MLRKLALLIAALSAVALGANTQIIDIIPSATGGYVSGSLNIAWPAFVSGGVSVPAGSMQYQIINGLVNLSLPAYNGYQVTYTLPPAASYTVYWSVPVSATPLTIAQVQVNYVPAPSLAILPSQLTQAGATDGQALIWDQATAMWIPGTVSGGIGACPSGLVMTAVNAGSAPTCSAPAYSWLTGAPTINYQTVQSNTTSQTQRLNLNFSSQFALTDSAGSNRTTVDLASTISASTTGNAATATALAATPSACPGGEYASAISANGTPTCSTPAGGGVTVTGSPAAGQMTAFSGPAAITTATGHNSVAPLACADISGSGTVQSCTTSPSFTLNPGDWILYTSTTASGATLTVAVNGSSPITVMKGLSSFGVATGDIPSNKYVPLYYDGTNLQLPLVHNECNIVSPTTNEVVLWTSTGCVTGAITFTGGGFILFGEPLSMGPDTTVNPINIQGTSTSSGVTTGLGIVTDTSNPSKYVTAALGQAFDAVSESTQAGSTTINIATVPGTMLTGIQDSNTTAGDLVGPSNSVKGELTDLGTTDQRQVPYNQSITGRSVVTNTGGAGFSFRYKYWGVGIYGTMVNGNPDLVAPTIASGFGTSPTISGKNSHGRVTVGTGSGITTGTVTFGSNFTNTPVCSVQDETAKVFISVSPTTSTLVIAYSFTAGDVVSWSCNGN